MSEKHEPYRPTGYAARVLKRLRENVAKVPLSVVKDHYYDENTPVDMVLLVDDPFDLAEIAAALFNSGEQHPQFLQNLLCGDVVKSIVSDPTSMPVDEWDTTLGFFDLDKECHYNAVYIKPVYFIQPVRNSP